ncbi:hypothetical protein BKA70DRAFT_1240423 [Coprinopsis sp. MPI-PUGE-AT-0042]|nr:hypothetical protein BKA70DRAFT_1240423 [Coprinopsis sp. MPI-PUGE-AT-0042]
MQGRIITSLIALVCISTMTAHAFPIPDLADDVAPVLAALPDGGITGPNLLAGGGEQLGNTPENVLGVIKALEHEGPIGNLLGAIFGRDSAPVANTASADELEGFGLLDDFLNSLIDPKGIISLIVHIRLRVLLVRNCDTTIAGCGMKLRREVEGGYRE